MPTDCQHTLQKTRKDGSSYCVRCRKTTYRVDKRECQHCAHFKDLGPAQDHHCICTFHMMGVTRTMHVSYDVNKGTCFTP